MKFFADHPTDQGETYIQHMKFAFSLASRMGISSVFFLTHGFFPFIEIPSFYNLESMSLFLREKNEKRKRS